MPWQPANSGRRINGEIVLLRKIVLVMKDGKIYKGL